MSWEREKEEADREWKIEKKKRRRKNKESRGDMEGQEYTHTEMKKGIVQREKGIAGRIKEG